MKSFRDFIGKEGVTILDKLKDYTDEDLERLALRFAECVEEWKDEDQNGSYRKMNGKLKEDFEKNNQNIGVNVDSKWYDYNYEDKSYVLGYRKEDQFEYILSKTNFRYEIDRKEEVDNGDYLFKGSVIDYPRLVNIVYGKTINACKHKILDVIEKRYNEQLQ